MKKAQKVGKAKQLGDAEEIALAEEELAAYEALVERSDKVSLNIQGLSLNDDTSEIKVSFKTLMKKAHKVGKAKKRGNPIEIALAEKELEAYESLVKRSSNISLGRY